MIRDWQQWLAELHCLYGRQIKRPDNYELQLQELRMDAWRRMKAAVMPETKAKYRQEYEDITARLIELADC